VTFRELMKYELWSKRTTRKILSVICVIFVVLFLGFFGWRELSMHWLTKDERAVAKIALQRIDALHAAESLSDQEFESRRNEADSAVDSSEKAVMTRKDEIINVELTMCLMGFESARVKMVEQRLIEQGKLRETANEWAGRQQSELLTDTLAHQYCLDLHKELD
jgi:hypothetical protein